MPGLISIVAIIFDILTWTVIIDVLLGWFIRDPYHPLRSFLDSIVEPMRRRGGEACARYSSVKRTPGRLSLCA
ncbi:MAG: YggT family protein [Chloroflexi bacterium]|nr:YggT family protein [Chloroflexota bacterium]